MALNNMGLGFLFTAKDLASGVMGNVKKNLIDVEGVSKRAATAMTDSFSSFGKGLAVAGIGIAGLAMLAPAIEEAAAFSKAIALVATEADAALYPQEKMREVAEQLAVTYGIEPVKQAQALYKAVALGANDAAKSTAFLNGVNLLAVAGNADLELSANALGGALNAYHAPFTKATEYSDALFTAMKQGNTTVQDLAGSIGRVTASAANLNISIDEILGAVAVMTNQGIQASEAVSGLHEALANVVHPSAQAAAEAARLGIKFNQTELRAKGLQGFLKEITSAANFNANSLSKLFTSVEGANAIMQVASNNMGAFNAVMDEMAHKAGATQKGFEIMTDTLDFQGKRFEATKKVFVGMIGSALEPMAKAALKFGSSILEAFTKAPKPLVAFLTHLFAGVSLVLTFVGVVLALKSAIALLSFGMGAIGITFGSLLAAMLPVVAIVGLGVLAIQGFRLAWEQNLGGMRDFFVGAWDKIKLTFQGLYQLFTDGGFSGAVRTELNRVDNLGLKQFAINVFVWVKRIENFLRSISEGFANGMREVEEPMRGLTTALARLGRLFQGTSEGADAAASTFDAFGTSGANTGEILAQAFGLVVKAATAIVDVIVGIGEGWDLVIHPAIDGSSSFSDALGGLAAALKAVFVQLGLMDTGTAAASSAWVTFGQVVGGALAGVVRVLTVIIQAVTWIIGAASKIASFLSMIHGGGPEAMFERAAAANDARGPLGFGAAQANAASVRSLGFSQAVAGADTRNNLGAAQLAPFGAALAPMPATAMVAPATGDSAGIDVLKTHLADIAKNTKEGQTVRAVFTLDGETIGRATAKAQKSDSIRGFDPLPVPG